jgi:REP element-mobilizing transposase RayT
MSRWKILPDIEHYFITSTIVDWEYVFTSEPYFDVIIHSLEYCMKNKGLHLHGYVIMPNHVHYIVSANLGNNISDIFRDFNTHTSREITRLLKSERRHGSLSEFSDSAQFDDRGNVYKVWQDGFHPIAIESEKFFLEKLQYIHENPVRKGYVEIPEHWKYSSARNYLLDDHSIIRVECL